MTGALCRVRHSFSCSSQRGMWLSGNRQHGNGLDVFRHNNKSSKLLFDQEKKWCGQCGDILQFGDMLPDYSHRVKCAAPSLLIHSSESVSAFRFNHTSCKVVFRLTEHERRKNSFSFSRLYMLPHPIQCEIWHHHFHGVFSVFPQSSALVKAFNLFGHIQPRWESWEGCQTGL